jgi:hypothetical protein
MDQINYLIRDVISDTYTEKFLEKLQEFPTEVLTIQLVIPPTAQKFITFDYQGAKSILDRVLFKANLDFDQKNRSAFLIEFEQHEFYTELSMELRIILTGEISEKTIKKIKKNTEDKPLLELDISSSFIELSNVSANQLKQLVRPYIPELQGAYDVEKLKIMNRVYLLSGENPDEKEVEKSQTIIQ